MRKSFAPCLGFFVAVHVFLLVLAISSCTEEQSTWSRIKSTGVLRVGLDPTFPPFEDASDGTLKGIDVDIALAIADQLGLQVDFIYFGYDGLYDALLSEQADVLISALAVFPEKTKDFAYSTPYFNAGQTMVFRDGSIAQAAEQFDAQRLAVELGAEGHVQATILKRGNAALEIQPYETGEEALLAVNDGQADAAIVDHVSGRLFLRDHDAGLVLADTMITDEPYAAVVRRQDDELLEQLDLAIEKMKGEEVMDVIISRWLD